MNGKQAEMLRKSLRDISRVFRAVASGARGQTDTESAEAATDAAWHCRAALRALEDVKTEGSPRPELGGE